MKRFLKALSIFVLLPVMVMAVACNKGDNPPVEEPIEEPVYIGNFKYEGCKIFSFDDIYFNIEFAVTNKSELEETFDFSKLVLTFNGRELNHYGNSHIYQPGQYYKWSWSIDITDEGLVAGDKVNVKYVDEVNNINIDFGNIIVEAL